MSDLAIFFFRGLLRDRERHHLHRGRRGPDAVPGGEGRAPGLARVAGTRRGFCCCCEFVYEEEKKEGGTHEK